MAAVELAEQPLGLPLPTGWSNALVEERARGGVDVRDDRRAIEPGRAAAIRVRFRVSRGEPRQLDRRATVHHDEQAGVERTLRCSLVDHPQLQPHGARTDANGLVDVSAGAVEARRKMSTTSTCSLSGMSERVA